MVGRIFVARQAFSAHLDGVPVVVTPGDTVREGHPLLKGREQYFAVQRVKYEHREQPVKKAAPRK